MRTNPPSLILAVALAGLMLCGAPCGDAWGRDILSQSYIEELKHYTVGDDRRREDPPAVDDPMFIRMSDASLYMEPEEVVFVEEPESGQGQVYVYPRSVLVQHEVVNLRDFGPRRTITYCPLTGSVVGINAQANDHHTTAFGTMGMLVNSNRMLYDRATNSLCPQLLGSCIRGPLKNVSLSRFPLLWTTWRYLRKQYPDALVLSRKTGWRMPYGRDPYGSYAREDTYYQEGAPYYPVAHTDTSLPPKARVQALAEGETAVAGLESEISKQGVASMRLGKQWVVAIYDPKFDASRVYYARADGRDLHFEMADGELVDLETRSRWNTRGRSISGRLRGTQLKRAASMSCMWFAWKAFHPYTRVWGREQPDLLSNLAY